MIPHHLGNNGKNSLNKFKSTRKLDGRFRAFVAVGKHQKPIIYHRPNVIKFNTSSRSGYPISASAPPICATNRLFSPYSSPLARFDVVS